MAPSAPDFAVLNPAVLASERRAHLDVNDHSGRGRCSDASTGRLRSPIRIEYEQAFRSIATTNFRSSATMPEE
jgi:hypothetical protein